MAMVSERYGIERRDALKVIGSAAAVGIGGVAGCLGGESGGGPTTASSSDGWPDLSGQSVHFITVAAEDSIQDLWQGVASDFENDTGASMEIEFVETGDLTRIIQLLQAGDPPEVSMQSIGEAYQLQNRDVLLPVDDEYERAVNKLGEPTESVKQIVTVDDSRYMVPLFHNLNSYTYRSDLSDIVPDTWEKVRQYAREIDDQDNDVRGTYVPIATGSPAAVRMVSWLWTNGGSISEWEDDTIHINFHEGENRDRMVEMLNFLKERQQWSPLGEGADWADLMNVLQSGTAASTWYAGARAKNEAIRKGRPFAKDIDITPGMPHNRQQVSDGSAEGLIAYQGADTQAAKTFINYVVRKSFVVELLTKLSPIHNVPSYPEIQQGEEYRNNIQSLDIWEGWTEEQFDNYQVQTLEQLQNKTQETSPPNPYTSTYYSEPIWNLQNEVLLQDEDPEAIIDTHAEALQQIVDEAQN